MSQEFEQLGFIKEYYIYNKFIGYVNIKSDENRKIGYIGKQQEEIKNLIVLHNGKKIKPLTIVTTIIYPKNGKMIK
jgi:hypothetical protein